MRHLWRHLPGNLGAPISLKLSQLNPPRLDLMDFAKSTSKSTSRCEIHGNIRGTMDLAILDHRVRWERMFTGATTLRLIANGVHD